MINQLNFSEINELIYNGKLIKAKKKWYKTIKKPCPESILLLIRIYNLLGQKRKSAKYFMLFEKHDSQKWVNNIEYNYQKAIYFINTDQLQKGKKFIDKAFFYPKSSFRKKVKILLLKSKYYAIMGQYSQQKEVLNKIHQVYSLKYTYFFNNFLERPISVIKNNTEDQQKDLLLFAEVLENYGYHAGNTYQPLLSKKRHKKAYDIRCRIFHLDRNHYLIARSLNNIGFCLRQNEQYKESRKLHEDAIERLKSSGFTEENYHYFARIYFNQAICHMETSEYNIAIKKLHKVIQLRELFYGKNHRYTLKAKINLARIFRKQGQINTALDHFPPNKKDLIELFKSDLHPKIARLHNDIAYCYLITSKYDKAERHYHMAKRIINQLIENGEESEKITLAKTLGYLGEVFRQKKKYKEAIETQENALKLNSSYYEKNKALENAKATTSLYLGMIYFDKESYTTALSFFKATEKIFDRNLNKSDSRKAKLYNRIGETYLQLENPKAAIANFRKAKNVFLRNYAKLTYQYIPVGIMELILLANLMNKKRFFLALNDRNIVDTIIGLADSYYHWSLTSVKFPKYIRFLAKRGLILFTKYLEHITDTMLEDCQPEKLRRRFAEKCKRYYGVGVKIAYKLQEWEPENKRYSAIIYRFIEKSKNGILSYNLMKLKEEQLKTNGKATKNSLTNLLTEIQSATNTIIQLEKSMFQTSNNELSYNPIKRRVTNFFHRQKLKNTYQKTLIELEESKIKLEQIAPDYYELKYNRSPVPYETLRKQFKPNSIILSYFITEEHIYINVITKERCYTVRKSKMIEGQDVFNQLKKQFISKFHSNHPKFHIISQKMYNWLIQPVEQYIENIADLVIIPDETLQLFPYQALVIPPKNKTEKTTYLIEKYTIMYHYSIWYFYKKIGQLSPQNQFKLLAIGPEFFPHVSNPRLCPLTRTVPTIKALQKTYKDGETTTLIREDATKENFFKHMKNAELIFIFSHGQASTDEENKSQPSLIFAPNKKDITDYRLRMSEFLKNGDLSNTSIVIFCCCDSGSGKSYAGEGVNAFNKAAINLGAKTVIYTIGGAGEEAAQKFMLVFNEQLLTGKGRRKAYQSACKALIADEKYSPRHWGVFAMIGSWNQNF